MNDHVENHAASTDDAPSSADSKADAIAAFMLIAVAVAGALFFISSH